jgi:hypothetical protein
MIVLFVLDMICGNWHSTPCNNDINIGPINTSRESISTTTIAVRHSSTFYEITRCQNIFQSTGGEIFNLRCNDYLI